MSIKQVSIRWCLITAQAVAGLATAAHADWNPGDGHKMHFPQLPDPTGWDVEFFTSSNKVGDDWVCSQTGPVGDIHIWLSWQADNVNGGGLPGTIDQIGVEIYDNDLSGPYSKPGQQLWGGLFDPNSPNVTRRPYGQGDQGWYSPQQGTQQGQAWQRPDHQFYEQLNIVNIDDPFVQVEGEVYWLVMWVDWFEGIQNPAGWKTADVDQYPQPFTGQHFEDDAVWWEWTTGQWHEIIDPQTGLSLDLAFVITPEPASLALLALGGLALVRRR